MINSKLISFFCGAIFSIYSFAQNDLQNNGNFQMHPGSSIGIFGNFTNNSASINNLGEIYFVGSALQTFDGSAAFNGHILTLDNNNNLKVDNELQISNSLIFSNGSILTDRADSATEFVHFLDNTTYSGESNSRHVDGVVRKTGDDVFVFPVGDDNNIQPIAISDPGTNPNDHFTAHYVELSPDSSGFNRSSTVASIHHVSDCEFWILDRTGGAANVDVTLSFDVNSCGVTLLGDLLVARWDGATWQDHGNGGTTGTVSAGTVVSSVPVSTFSPFTLASSTINNPLPIDLISFDAKNQGDAALLTWITASEINNDFFELEKSIDGIAWSVINKQNGTGNSSTLLTYNYVDNELINGIQYYRLKQTDFDGQYTYSHIEYINYENNISLGLVYPNPNNGLFDIEIHSSVDTEITSSLYNNIGELVYSSSSELEKGRNTLNFNLKNYSSGLYYLTLKSLDNEFISQTKVHIQ
ncbi:MAG: T9SS type A sorting domain-containing protein [Crocinitomicaceae bacterium]